MAISISGTTGITFGDGTTQLDSPDLFFSHGTITFGGYNTVLTNSTGWPLHVHCIGNSLYANSVSYTLKGFVNGIEVAAGICVNASSAWETYTGISFIVPIGGTYQITTTGINPFNTIITY